MQQKKVNKPQFWVSNVSKMNVSLADLNLTIKAFTTVNLLDDRHYSYTYDELVKSVTEGSIYKKQDKIKVRESAPETFISPMSINYQPMPSRGRSAIEIKEEKYEELDLSDEEFADQNADLAEADRMAGTKEILK